MGVLDFFKGPNINDGLLKYSQLKEAYLVDIRPQEDYVKAHVPGAVSLPMEQIGKAIYALDNKLVPVFVYDWDIDGCRRGVKALRSLGYVSVTELGACDRYTGELESGMPNQKTEE